ncbi:MAG TPA: hypothetical protein VFF14_05190 [Candidatus Deferrimicrobium sp.]|nr:hypothetical protein [Candidatus Deferrimicrobium sp.]
MMKSKILLTNISFALTASILAILLGLTSNFATFYMGGWATAQDHLFEGLLITAVFLIAWLLYGRVIGYKKEKGFLIFISLYWGIGGLISLIAIAMAPIGKFAIIVIPIDMIILVPTFALTYFYSYSSDTLYLVTIVSIIVSWSAGMIGYFLGYSLEKAKK